MNVVTDIDPRTLQQQALASDPSHSAWVSANAGSGKTHVLTQRVVRLLLAGCDPSRILCLTFTKAAAGEMANRVFETLGKWATCDEQELVSQLENVTGEKPHPQLLQRSRTLFARALETPGGLKIQTIHAFCEALLHQFPLEANVPGNFSVMDENAQQELLEQTIREIFASVQGGGDAPSKHLAQIMSIANDHGIDKVQREFINRRSEIGPWLQYIGGPDAAERLARQHFGFADDLTLETLLQRALDEMPIKDELLNELAIQCACSDHSYDKTLARRLTAYQQAKMGVDKLNALGEVFLNSDGDIRAYSRFCSNDIKKHFPDLETLLGKEGQRLIDVQKRINLFRTIEGSRALYSVVTDMLDGYNRRKRQRGLLDYDDLIDCTARLLSAPSRAWVMYKLDMGINHVLLDEAQDTSPRQWQIIRSLVDEFFSGENAHHQSRTIFAVGDEKQSIYSFQGAQPELFAQNRSWMNKKADAAGQGFANAYLNLSFRSTTDVLGAVDAVFAIPENCKGLTFDGDYSPHTARRRNSPGQVDIWPLAEGEKAVLPEVWHEAVDLRSNRHQADILARRIADQIGNWIEHEEHCSSTNRPMKPGDIIVLVRARDRFTNALTRYLKEAGIPVAGADRLKLTDHIAIQDLLALGSFVVTPEDDLSLAAILKCPLIGLSEDDLFNVSAHRKGSLYSQLLAHADDPVYQRPVQLLKRWVERANQVPVYEFYAMLLGADRGRQLFQSRLGAEVNDVLDAFLEQALAHERQAIPGLQGFVEALVKDAPEIKREFDQQSGEVRIMTVHAAKGLEAPVVFLVDKCSHPFQAAKAQSLLKWGDPEHDPKQGGYLWLPSSKFHSDMTRQAYSELKAAAENEYRRLLYVGMTRARDRLIVCGYRSTKELPDPNWHTMVMGALEPSAEQITDEDGSTISHRWRSAQHADQKLAPSIEEDDASKGGQAPLPDWVNHRFPKESALPRPLAPSGAQALIDETLMRTGSNVSVLDNDSKDNMPSSRQRGIVLHRLFEHLPDVAPDQREALAEKFLQQALPGLSDSARSTMVRSVIDIISSSDIRASFDPETSRAEVPIIGTIELPGGTRAVSGTVDRLSVVDNEVVLLDFKTGGFVPSTPENTPGDYLTQMAIYREMIRQIYPQKPIRCALIWTQAEPDKVIMHLPDALLDMAYAELSRL